MLTPDEARHVGDGTADAYDDMETEMLSVAAMYLTGLSELSNYAINKSAGKLAAKLNEIIAKHREEAARAVSSDVSAANERHVSTELDAAQADDAVSSHLGEMFDGYRQETAATSFRQMQGISQTMKDDARAKYLSEAYKAAVDVRAGRKSSADALSDAVSNLASQGITANRYVDKNGTVYNAPVDAGVRGIIETQVQDMMNRETLEIARETGENLVEVSAHGGARPSHAVWQGEVYQLDGESKEYRNFYKACNVGNPVTGIGGYNCRHTYGIWHPGTSRRWDKDPLEGTGYTNEEVYKLKQKQRGMENDIRKLKREADVMRNSGLDPHPVNSKIYQKQGQLRQLVSDNSKVLYRDRFREKSAETYSSYKKSGSREPFLSKKEFNDYKKQVVSNAIKEAKRNEPAVTRMLKSLQDGSSIKLEGLEFKIKESQSLRRKIDGDFAEAQYRDEKSYSDISSSIHDNLRYTYISTDKSFGRNFLNIKENMEEDGYLFVRVKNTMANTNGSYRGVNTLVKNEDGYTFELQFHTRESFDAKMEAHGYYEIARAKSSTEAEVEAANDKMKKLFSFKTPSGVQDIEAFDKTKEGL